MGHDPALLDALSRRPQSTFTGRAVLYTSLKREGALAEIAFHWGQLTPMPRRPVALHMLAAGTDRWPCESLMVFMEHVPLNRELSVVATERIDWIVWAQGNNLLPR